MKCPRDGAALAARPYEAKIEIDECPLCGGMWLDHGELEAIQQTVERDYREALDEPSDSVAEGLEGLRQRQLGAVACLKCGVQMDARPYGQGSQVVIDVCPEGCGVWLDQGEMATLEKLFERSQQENEIPLRWRMWAALRNVLRRRAARLSGRPPAPGRGA
jgi:Zn-finger nucleic acid-binding protein